MSEVSVMCGRKRCGEEKWDEVCWMRDVSFVFRGWETGGKSQSDEPGIFEKI
jgi:hypothetical protein